MALFIFWLGLALLVGVVGKDRKIGFGLAFFWSILLSPIIGLVIALLSDKLSETKTQFKHSLHFEEAKKHEFKGNIPAAIDKYLDALFHLENDKMSLNKNQELLRLEMIEQTRKRIENLKQKQSNPIIENS
jgi:hypothetical protein